MYLLILIGASVILYQYQAWVMTQNNSQDINQIYGYKNDKKADIINVIPAVSNNY